MRPFYIDKNKYGYYRVRFTDEETGQISFAKSTHTKDYAEALKVVTKWMGAGVPVGQITSLVRSREVIPVKQKILLNTISSEINKPNAFPQEMALIMLSRLAEKFGIDLSSAVAASSTPAVQAVQLIQNNITVESVKNTVCVPEQLAKNLPGSGSTKSGLTGPAADMPLEKFLVDFWNPEISGYVKDRRAHGHGCTNRHCNDMRKIVLRSAIPYFGNVKVGSITAEAWDDFFLDQKIEKGLANASVNHIINACKKPFDYALKKHQISDNPLATIERFAKDSKERGILNDEEVSQLFSSDWHNPVSKLANMVAAFCGMRIGEVQALRTCDIGKGCINIMHNWSTEDGLKCTKNGDVRQNPMPQMICEMLNQQAKRNPLYSETSYVFFSPLKPEQPIVCNVFEDSLYEEMRNIGISEELRVERNIVFHSWRHYYATLLVNQLKINEAQQALGHRNAEMTEHYSNHETKQNYQAIEKVVNENFVHLFKLPA